MLRPTKTTWVPPEINVPEPGTGILIIGRDPGRYEVEPQQDELTGISYPHGRPFVGPAGGQLGLSMAAGGFVRHEANFTNVVGIRPPDDDFAQHDPGDVEEGLERLYGLLARLRPPLIVTLGNEAAYALVPDWPTRGRGIFGAKDITERRGFFWETPYGWVLTLMHPAAVARNPVPGQPLLDHDFGRARRWLAGELPRQTPPKPARFHHATLPQLLSSKLVAWDIETRWDNTSLLCSGFCGDDLVPYVALYPREFELYGRSVLSSAVPKVGHNGPNYDIPICETLGITVQNYQHDTQYMWWALEPELAGQDETGGDEVELHEGAHRMTRKGLAFLCTIRELNVPWWKNYPEKDDPAYVRKMLEICAVDVWATRQLADDLLGALKKAAVLPQYTLAMAVTPAAIAMHHAGLYVDEPLRQQRIAELTSREEQLKAASQVAGLDYVTAHELEEFSKLHRCSCCGGGKTTRAHCWQCGGLPKKPKGKGDYRSAQGTLYCPPPNVSEDAWKTVRVAELRSALPQCRPCQGTGKIRQYAFKPTSEKQLKRLLYDHLGTPKSYQRGKLVSDDAALRNVLRWAK